MAANLGWKVSNHVRIHGGREIYLWLLAMTAKLNHPVERHFTPLNISEIAAAAAAM